MVLQLPGVPSLFNKFLNKPSLIKVYGESGVSIEGGFYQPPDFEFGDIVVWNNPDDQVLAKFEGIFFFGHQFKTSDGINRGVWPSKLDDGTGTYSVISDKLVLNSPALNDNVRVVHAFNPRQAIVGDVLYEAKIKCDAGGASANIKFGLGEGTAGTFPGDGAYFELNTDENTFRPVVQRASSATNGNDFTVTNNTWNTFKITMTTNSASFYMNGTLIQTLTGANVPDDQNLYMGFRSDHEGDSSKLTVDWCKVEWG